MNIYGKRNLCSLPQYKILITEQGGSDAQLKANGKNTDVRVGTQNYHLAVYFLLFLTSKTSWSAVLTYTYLKKLIFADVRRIYN